MAGAEVPAAAQYFTQVGRQKPVAAVDGVAPARLRYPFLVNDIKSPASDAERWEQADALVTQGRIDEAIAAYRGMQDSEALIVPAAVRLSQIAMRQGRMRDAVDCALTAFQLRRGEPDLLLGVARALGSVGEFRAMFASAHDIAVLRARNPDVMVELGALLLAAGFPHDALQMLDRARGAGATGTHLAMPRARALQALGRDEEAASVYGGCIEAAPTLVAPWLGLAETSRRGHESGLALAGLLKEMLAEGGEDPASARLHYALFHLLDRAGDAEGAWAALERGMRHQRAILSGYHDPAADEALLDHLATVQGDDASRAAPGEGPAPVFLVGLHAPAIAAFGALLARHPQVGDIGEARDFALQLRWCADAVGPPWLDLALAQRAGDVDFAQLGERYLAHTAWRATGRVVMLDRNPANFANVAYIARALPNARILHLSAGPMDTCFSALSAWTDPEAPWSHDQAETAAHYRGYRRLMAHWRSQFPKRVLDVRQDELLADPAAVLDEVLRFCGLDAGLAPRMAEDVPAQLGEGRAAPQRWRAYEEPLAPLKAGLGALAY